MTGNLKPNNRAGEELMPLADLPAPGAKGFSLGEGTDSVDIFLVRNADGDVMAYRNVCPHVGSPLDWMPDQFLDMDEKLIQCATHNALFRMEDGACISGPCNGVGLTPVAIRIQDEAICLAETVS
ncbi:MAG: Rieske (2Fe-2S) protein [Gammaproteobacteria bacterium]